jgi:hypothetical protein
MTLFHRSDASRWQLSCHEAAHLTAFLLHDVTPTRAWIARDGKSGQVDMPENLQMKYYDNIICLHAGESADLQYFGIEPNDNSHDRQVARRLADQHEKETGKKWYDTYQRARKESLALVKKRRKAIEIIAGKIYDDCSIDGDVASIMLHLIERGEDTPRKRPYGDGFFRAASGNSTKPEFGSPGDPLTEKLFRRAQNFWTQHYASRGQIGAG